MRKFLIAAVVALVAIMPIAASAQSPSQGQTAGYNYNDDFIYPLVLGVGALLGVIAVNVVSSGYVGVIPYQTGLAAQSTAAVTDWTATALSRVYAVTGVVVGGWIANWLYTGQ